MFKLRKLEDRIVLDGAGMADALDELNAHDAHDDQMFDLAKGADQDAADHGLDTDEPLFAEDADDAPSADEGLHVLVVSNDIANSDALAAAAKDDVLVVQYDASETDLGGLAGLIHKALGGRTADTIAFAAHGEGAQIELASGDPITADSLDSSDGQKDFWQAVAGELAAGGRIDLLGCNVVEDESGKAFLEKLEEITDVDFAASANATGNPASDEDEDPERDWVLESDDIDIASTYFKTELVKGNEVVVGFEGVLQKPVYNGGLPPMITVEQGQYNTGDIIYTIPAGTWTDPTPSHTLTYGISGAATWLGFDRATQQFYLAQPMEEFQTDTIKDVTITVMDPVYNFDQEIIQFNAVGANDPPLITTGDAINYTEGDGAVVLDSTIDVVDPDSGDNIEQALIKIGVGFVPGEDVLAFGGAGLNAFYNSSLGELLLTGSDTPANYAAALETVTYENTSANPTVGTRTISWVVDDGVTSSAADTSTVSVVGSANAPDITAGGALSYTENDPAATIDGAIQVSDPDSNLTAATISFGGNYVAGEDMLSYTGTLTSAWDSTTGVMTLTGSDTPANYAAALGSVTYANTSEDPSAALRTITWTVTDGTAAGSAQSTIDVTPVNDPPVATAGNTLSYSEGDGTVTLESALALTDAEGDTITGATVTISGGYANGEDFLDVPNVGAITSIFNNGVLTLQGSDSVANYQAALRQVTFQNIDASPIEGVRTIQWVVNDGTDDSAVVTSQVDVGGVNDPPMISATGSAAFTEDAGAVAIDTTIAISDPESINMSAATVQFVAGFIPGNDILGYVGTLNSAYDTSTGVLTLMGTDSIANYEAALQSVTYNNLSDTPSTADRYVSWQIADAGGLQNLSDPTSKITVTAANDIPVITADGAAVYTEGDPAVVIDAGVLVEDPDNTRLRNAYVSIGAGYQDAEDRLTFTSVSGIFGSFDSATGTLTFAGIAPLADYETVLSSVAYENIDIANPTEGIREITWQVKDYDNALSATASGQVTVIAGNNAPALTAGNTLGYTEGDGTAVIDPTLTVQDADLDDITAATALISENYESGNDMLQYIGANGNLSTLWNAVSGKLTITGTDTLAAYQQALREVVFINDSADPSTLTREVTFTVNDGLLDSATDAAYITISGTTDAPVVTAGNAVNYTENDPAVAMDPGISVSDVDSANLQAATVAVDTGFVVGEDILSYTGSLTGSYNSTTGVMTLTGSDTVANYEAALASVSYENTSDDPTAGVRTIIWTVNDGGNDSATVSSTVNVAPVNDAPVLTAGSVVDYTEGMGTMPIDIGIDAFDAENDSIQAATVSLGAGFVAGEDFLSYGGGLTSAYDSNAGVLTLSGANTFIAYQTALRSVAYENTSANATAGARTVSWTINDGTADSTVVTSQINVNSVNDAPVVTAGNVVDYTENDGAVTLSGALDITDPDGDTMKSATVSFTSGFVSGEDVLSYGGFLVSSWDAGNGVLTLTGTWDEATFAGQLQNVTYENVSDDPSTGDRVISWSVSDGTDISTAVTTTVRLTAVNDAPEVTAAATLDYTEGTGPVAVDAAVSVSDADDVNIEGATVSITNYVAGEDHLAFPGDPNIVGTFNSTTGVMTLQGITSVANYEAALAAITYENSSMAPDTTPRQVTWVVNDGMSDSAAETTTINIVSVNAAPILTGGFSLGYTEGDATLPVDPPVLPDLELTDADGDMMRAATVAFTTGYEPGEDLLAYSGALTTAWDAINGILTLTGSDTIGNYLAALRSITYENLDTTSPTEGVRVLTWTVNDGTVDSNTVTSQITVTAVNSPPVVTAGNIQSYTEGDGAVIVDGTVDADDIDNTALTSARITISGGYAAGEDMLAYGGTTLGSTWNSTTGTLTLTGSASLADYDAALQTVTYENTDITDPTAGVRTVSFVVNDGLADSTTVATAQIDVISVNDPPILTSGASQDYLEDSGTVAVDAAIQVSDADDVLLTGAWVQIDPADYVAGEDVLGYTSVGGINGTFNTGLGILSFTGTNSLANYELLLQGVTYENTAGNDPTTGLRTIQFWASDGTDDSAIVTSTVNVIDVNDPPILTAGDSQNYTEGDGPVPVDTTITITDADSSELQGAVVTISGGYEVAEDQLNYTTTNGITGSYFNGTLTLSGPGSLLDYEGALEAVRYVNNNATDPVSGTRTISFWVNDGADDSNTDVAEINVVAVNSPPAVTAGATQDYTEGDGTVTVDGTITVADVDNTSLTSARVTITGGFASGEDVLVYDGTDFGGPQTATGGVLTLVGTDSLANYESALESITYQNVDTTSPTTGTRTLTFVVNDGTDDSATGAAAATAQVNVFATNTPPVVTAGGSAAFTEGGPTTVIDGAIAVSDADDTELVSATVEIDPADYTSGEDVLSFTPVGGINGTFFAASGQLVLTGTDTVENYEAALQSVTYDNLNEINPVTGARTIWYWVNDGDADSATQSSEITVVGVNDPPALTSGATLDYTEGDLTQAIDPAVDVSDLDSTSLSAATATLSGYVPGEDVLWIENPTAAMSVDFDTTSGVLTITGSDDIVNYLTALRSMSYENTSDDPTTGQRVVEIVVADDGAALSNTAASVINVFAVNNVPLVTAGDTILYTEGDGKVVIDDTITITDLDDGELVSAKISVTGGTYVFGEDVLGFVPTASIGANWDPALGVLTLFGTDTLANYEAALESVTYENVSATPTEVARTIEFIVNDGEDDSTGGANATAFVGVTAVNDPPVVTAGGVSYYTEGDGAVVVDAGIDVFEPEGDQITAATVAFGANFQSPGTTTGDWLAAAGWTFDTTNGVLTLDAPDSAANVQADLRSMTYLNDSDNPTEGKRTLSITLYDGTDFSVVKKEVIWVVGVNDAPDLTATGTQDYIEGDGTTFVDNNITLWDDGTGLTGATVSIDSLDYVPGEDVLGYIPVAGVNVNAFFDTIAGVLTLTGTETVGNYELALENVTYENTANLPGTALKNFTFSVNDGEYDSETGLNWAWINIEAVDDPPLITAGDTVTYTEGGSAVIVDADLDITDGDTATFTTATAEITLNGEADDRLAFDDAAFANITATYNSNTNTLRLVGTDTVANYEAALRTVTFDNVNDLNPGTLQREVTFRVFDGLTAATDRSYIDIQTANDAPVLTGGGTVEWTEGAGTVILDTAIQATDPDDDELTQVKVNITAATFQAGEDVLTYSGGNASTYNSATGVLTITGTETAPTWAADIALNVGYWNSGGDDPTDGVRAVKFSVYDGALWSNITTVEVNVVSENDAPVLTTGFTQNYTEGDGAVSVDAGISVTDVDSMLVAATVAFDPAFEYVAGEDMLAYSGTLVSAWDSVNGVLTLTGSDTPANYQAALQSVTYENLDTTSPTTGVRQIVFTVNDGEYDSTASAVEAAQVNVIAVNSPPEVTSTAHTYWTEGDPAVVLDPGVQVSDLDDMYFTGARVIMSDVDGYVSGEDKLNFIDTANIVGDWDTTTYAFLGILTLSGTDTIENYEAALASVTYTNLAGSAVTSGDRIITFSVNDGHPGGTDLATMTLTVAGINDAPVLTSGFTQDYDDNLGAVTVDAGVVITDVDDVDMNSARVTITGGYVPGEDYLDVGTSAKYIRFFDSTTGTLTIQGTDTEANYQAALGSVTYENMGGLNPTEGLRTIEFVVNDGDDDSTGLVTTAGILVDDINDAPVVTTVAGTVDWTEGDAPVALDANLGVTDPDSAMLSAATLIFGASYTAGDDYLHFTDTVNIDGTWNSVAGRLRLIGSDTVANYEAALRSVAYENLSQSPVPGTRAIKIDVADEEGLVSLTTATTFVNVMDVNDPPVLTASGTIDYVEEAGTGSMSTMLLDSALDLTDPDDDPMTGAATVTFTAGFQSGEDQLVVTSPFGLATAYDTTTGILTLTGTTSVANWESALRSVAYGNWVDDLATPWGDNPTSGQRWVTFTISDGQDINNAVLDTVAVNVIPTNDPAEVSTVAATVGFTEDAGAVQIDAAAAITDVDDRYLESAVISIDNFEPGEDVLNFTNAYGITGSWDGLTGTLTLSGHSLVEHYESALQSITYNNLSDDPTTGIRNLSITVNDGDIDSAAVDRWVDVNNDNDAPVVTSGATLEWIEGDGTQVVDATLQVDDVDNTGLAGATVQFTAGSLPGDVLAAPGFAYAGGVLTGGADSVANIELALQQMTYEHTSADPGTAQRVLLITVSDGPSVGTDTAVINVTPVNDAPVVTAGNTIGYTEGGTDVGVIAAIDPTLAVTDADSSEFMSARVTVANYVAGEDVLDFVDTPSISSTWDSVNGVLTLSGTDTTAEYQAALQAVTYQNLNYKDINTEPREIQFVVNDGMDDSNIGSSYIQFGTTLNDAPLLTADGTVDYEAGDAPVVLDPGAAVTDWDDANLQSATVAINNFQAGDVLDYTMAGAITSVYDGAGTLTLFGSDTVSNWQAAMQSITFENTDPNPNTTLRTVQWTVNDGAADSGTASSYINVTATNDPPIVTAGVTANYTEGDPAIVIDNSLDITDPEGDQLTGAEVRIVGYDPAVSGSLNINNAFGLATAFDTSTGVLTLTGTNSTAIYEAALRTVTYENLNDAPPATETIQYTVDDDATNTSAPVTSVVSITPVNDGPTAPDSVYFLAEDAGNGVSVGTVDATDPEGDTITYSILSGDTYGIFTIDPNTGVITVADNTNLDYETEDLHVLQIGMEDDGTPVATSSAQIAVVVTDVDETTSSYTVENALQDVDHRRSTTWIYTVPDNTFTAPETGHNISYEAEQTGGIALPTWLTFDESTKTFLYYSGTAPLGTVNIDVTAVYTTDGGVEVDRVTDTFDLTIIASLDLEILDALQYLEGDGTVDGLPAEGEAVIMVADATPEIVEDGENLGDILALLEMTDVDADAEEPAPAEMTNVEKAAADPKTGKESAGSAMA